MYNLSVYQNQIILTTKKDWLQYIARPLAPPSSLVNPNEIVDVQKFWLQQLRKNFGYIVKYFFEVGVEIGKDQKLDGRGSCQNKGWKIGKLDKKDSQQHFRMRERLILCLLKTLNLYVDVYFWSYYFISLVYFRLYK